MATKKIELLFSDVDFGVHEWGFLLEILETDPRFKYNVLHVPV